MPGLRCGSTERRYVLYQVPGTLLVAALLGVAWASFGLPGWIAVTLLVAWVAKDVVLYPFVRSAYERTPGGVAALVGAEAVVVSPLAPRARSRGRVRIGAETWRAELEEGSGPLAEGTRVIVTSARGLTLVVRARSAGS